MTTRPAKTLHVSSSSTGRLPSYLRNLVAMSGKTRVSSRRRTSWATNAPKHSPRRVWTWTYTVRRLRNCALILEYSRRLHIPDLFRTRMMIDDVQGVMCGLAEWSLRMSGQTTERLVRRKSCYLRMHCREECIALGTIHTDKDWYTNEWNYVPCNDEKSIKGYICSKNGSLKSASHSA